MSKQRTFKTIIMEDLRKQGLEVIANKIISITYESFSMGNAVRVKAVDLFKSEREQLEKILQSYAYGRFDAMTDFAYSDRDDSKERQAKYITLSNDFNEVVKRAVKLKLSKMGVDDDVSSREKLDCYYEQAVWQELVKVESYDQLISILSVGGES